MLTVAEFRIRFPEFEDDLEYSDERIQLFIDDTIAHMGDDESRWCNKYNLAQAYLTAHLLTIASGSEAGDTSAKSGPISSKTAGGVSVTHAVTASDSSHGDNFYMSTAYGQYFIVIRNSCFIGVMVTG